jgi:hypothetical protein
MKWLSILTLIVTVSTQAEITIPSAGYLEKIPLEQNISFGDDGVISGSYKFAR